MKKIINLNNIEVLRYYVENVNPEFVIKPDLMVTYEARLKYLFIIRSNTISRAGTTLEITTPSISKDSRTGLNLWKYSSSVNDAFVTKRYVFKIFLFSTIPNTILVLPISKHRIILSPILLYNNLMIFAKKMSLINYNLYN